LSAALIWLLLAAPADRDVDTVVVCPQEFRPALAPWLEHRRRQGHRVALLSNLHAPAALRAEIRRLARLHPLRYVLLVGDAEPAMADDVARRARSVPTHYERAVVNVRFGSEPEIPTDNWYADLNDDRTPELAVGRLTADSPAELSVMVAKILAYESCSDFGHWRRQIHFVAGLGGFGPLTDAVLEAAAKTLITGGIPASYATTMTYGSWQSPYCPDPRQFDRVTLDRLNEGSLFWVYIGHGQQRAVDMVRVPGGEYPILGCPEARRLSCRHGAPIACILACYSGAFDQPRDCLAEEMLRQSRGPVAVLCGSRVTMPYGMAVLGAELLEECFVRRPTTLGDLVVAAKRHTIEPPATSRHRAALDAVGQAFSWATGGDSAEERAEHLDLFHLLGDPLLRLPHPRQIELRVQPTAAAPGRIDVAGSTPVAGKCTIELVVRRDRLTFEPPMRDRFDARRLGEYGAVYQQANEPRLAAREIGPIDGPFEAQLPVPDHARGACHVRVFVQGTSDCAAGAADVTLRPTDAPD
jgi:hypothetical protein